MTTQKRATEYLGVRVTPRTLTLFQNCRALGRALDSGATADRMLGRALGNFRVRLIDICRRKGIDYREVLSRAKGEDNGPSPFDRSQLNPPPMVD